MNIVLFGDACRDVFVAGDCSRLSPEAPVAVLNPTETTETAGMGGNVLANLQSLSPDFPRWNFAVYFPDRLPVKTRYVDRKTGHHFVRVDEPDTCNAISDTGLGFKTAWGAPDAVVVSDYAKGFLPPCRISIIGEYCQKMLVPWFLDTKRVVGPWAKGAILKINATELENNLSAGVRPWEHVSGCIVTNGAQGMDLYGPTGDVMHHVEGPIMEVRDGAGCGDTVLAALVVAYLENGFDLKAAMAWADKAGRVAVSKRGVVAVKREEVL